MRKRGSRNTNAKDLKGQAILGVTWRPMRSILKETKEREHKATLAVSGQLRRRSGERAGPRKDARKHTVHMD